MLEYIFKNLSIEMLYFMTIYMCKETSELKADRGMFNCSACLH